MKNGKNSGSRRRRPRIYEDGTTQGRTPQEQEASVAEDLGGRRQPGSGSSDYAKGDVKQGTQSRAAFQSNRFLIECKQTKKASLRIEGKWLAKITREAGQAGREPALHFEIQGCDDPLLEREWVAVPMSVFKRIVDDEDP